MALDWTARPGYIGGIPGLKMGLLLDRADRARASQSNHRLGVIDADVEIRNRPEW